MFYLHRDFTVIREISIVLSFAILGAYTSIIVFSFKNMEHLQCAQVESYLDIFAYISQ